MEGLVMGKAMKSDLRVSHDTGLSAIELRQIYTETVEELERFSRIKPSEIEDDVEMEKAEIALLDFEDYLVEQASRAPLKTQEDITALMDIWAKVSTSSEDNCGRSDKIVKNIFRHLSR